jgi:hypothetical protein
MNELAKELWVDKAGVFMFCFAFVVSTLAAFWPRTMVQVM